MTVKAEAPRSSLLTAWRSLRTLDQGEDRADRSFHRASAAVASDLVMREVVKPHVHFVDRLSVTGDPEGPAAEEHNLLFRPVDL